VIKQGTVLYASDDSDVSVKEAREYISKHKFTGDDVKLVRKNDAILVISKVEVFK